MGILCEFYCFCLLLSSTSSSSLESSVLHYKKDYTLVLLMHHNDIYALLCMSSFLPPSFLSTMWPFLLPSKLPPCLLGFGLAHLIGELVWVHHWHLGFLLVAFSMIVAGFCLFSNGFVRRGRGKEISKFR